MGNGIAQACAVAGVAHVMIDVSDAAVKGHEAIDGSLDRLVKKDKISATDRDAALIRAPRTTDYAALAGCDLVIEAATENLGVKLEILRKDRRGRGSRCRHRHQHVVDLDHPARRGHCSRPTVSSACTSSIRCR